MLGIGRIEKMGHKIYRIDGVLYHLTHQRTHNSSDANPMYNHNGNETLYSGIYGTPFNVDIFMGVVYYQRLRHMVSDKS